jgi:regulator of sigma E protease
MSLVIFIIVLSVLIIVHEFGHFLTARSLGVKVERFSVGFGPKLWSRMHRGTEFMVCAIPLGGYVKMAGDERSQIKGLPEEYYSKPPGHRALIVLMGPVVNYVLAYLCLCLVFMLGYPTLSNKVGEVLEGYPAHAAGLQTGDRIIGIDSRPTDSWEDVKNYISQSPVSSLELTIEREGSRLTRTITPQLDVLENIFGQKEEVPVVGIKPEEEIVTFRYGPGESILKGGQKLWEITVLTYKALYRIATGAMAAKDAVTGPIGIFYIIREAATMGFSYLLYIVGIISASLAIFNLLPFPVLDGGHMVFLAVERIRGQSLPEKVEENIARVGISLLICLALFVFYCDLVRFGWFDKLFNLWQ